MKQDKYYLSWEKIKKNSRNRKSNYIPHPRPKRTEEEIKLSLIKEKERLSNEAKKYRDNPNNNLKIKARKIVYINIRNGNIKKKPCEVCGEEKSHAHHEDYNKPLDIIWLCSFHHGIRHAK